MGVMEEKLFSVIAAVGAMMLGVIGYFLRDIHVRFEKHLDENQRAHEQMREAMSEMREEAGRVEERQDAQREELRGLREEVKAMRGEVRALPDAIVRVISDYQRRSEGR